MASHKYNQRHMTSFVTGKTGPPSTHTSTQNMGKCEHVEIGRVSANVKGKRSDFQGGPRVQWQYKKRYRSRRNTGGKEGPLGHRQT